MEQLGIKVISSSINASAVDIPAISAEVVVPMQDTSYDGGVIDVGGDPAGARTLGRYKDYLVEGNYDMFFCVKCQ